MKESLAVIEYAQEKILIGVMIILTIMVFLCLYHAIKGPKVPDRIIAINMMGTLVIVIIAILAVLKGQGYIIDICIIYAMISFLSVIVLTKVYMGVYLDEKEKNKEETSDGDI